MTEPTRANRPGDSQPLPTASDSPHMHDLVAEDFLAGFGVGDLPLVERVVSLLADRKLIGIERYGHPLQAFNGRKPALDGLEEALDLSVYIRQAMHENTAGSTLASLTDAYENTLVVIAILASLPPEMTSR